jgi:CheY-like chemotaxis protein
VTLPATTAVEATGSAPGPTVVAGRRLNVLIIDDQVRFLNTLQQVLRQKLDVHVAASGLAALELLRAGQRFDAIVCDVMMPEFSGVDFYEAMARERPELIPKIVFMTGGAYSPKARAFLDSVPNARIEKPFWPEQLEAVLSQVCGSASQYH